MHSSRGCRKRWKRQQQEARSSDLEIASEAERTKGMSPESLDAAMMEEFEGLQALEEGDTFMYGGQLLRQLLIYEPLFLATATITTT